ncbi:MAG TPA: hypothetical protein VG276_00945 [Actinomycetes bacterium]|jgi:hypothetical protein|nr:hypothetical protein [Actinomycetes bacterium]
MAVIITLAMVLLVASAALAVTGTGRRGKGAPERDDRNRADAVRVPTPAVRVPTPEEPARPHQGFRVAGVRHTAWSPTGGPGPGHPAGPPLIAPLAGRRLAGQ